MPDRSYQELRAAMAAALRREAEAQEAGRPEAVGAGYEEFDLALLRDAGPDFRKLLMALEFWDEWLDERNHGWPNFYGIRETDWPVFARQIAADLEADREFSDPFLRAHYAPRPPRPPGRIRTWFARWLGA
jgi:hypothetical protein